MLSLLINKKENSRRLKWEVGMNKRDVELWNWTQDGPVVMTYSNNSMVMDAIGCAEAESDNKEQYYLCYLHTVRREGSAQNVLRIDAFNPFTREKRVIYTSSLEQVHGMTFNTQNSCYSFVDARKQLAQ